MPSFGCLDSQIAILTAILLGTMNVVSAQKPPAIDFADREAHRLPVAPPATAIMVVDLSRTKENVALWVGAVLRGVPAAQRRLR